MENLTAKAGIDLPSDFLSTPFGQMLRPTIDSMFRSPSATPATATPPPVPSPVPAAANPPTDLAASLLQAMALQASGASASVPPSSNPSAAAQTLTAPVHIITNTASFQSFLRTHKAAAAFFTSRTCPPCRMIEPIFERLAEEKGPKTNGGPGVGFAKIDIDVGAAQSLASQWSIRATPTFIFFLDGNKVCNSVITLVLTNSWSRWTR
jgi:desumoylating isopeptidase 1